MGSASVTFAVKEIVLSLLLVFSSISVLAQQPAPSIKPYLNQISGGWLGDAKKALPDLLIDYPDDPAVTFLHASLVEDPKRAKPLLERIVTAYPKSEYADDALLRLIIEAATLKEQEGARKLFTQMREQYSNSELLWVAYDVLRTTVGVPPPAADKPPITSKKPEPLTPGTSTTTTNPTSSSTSTQALAAPKTTYSLLVSTTPNKVRAAATVEQFKKKRMRVRMIEHVEKKKNRSTTNYIVLVGEYTSEAAANKDLPIVTEACKCKPTLYSR